MRLCSGAGCGRKVAEDVRYCDECKTERGEAVNADDTRTHTTGYTELEDSLRKTARWQSIRRTVLHRDPFCKRCDAATSEICDHVVPALVAIQQAQESKRYPLDKHAGYFLLSNLQGLCRSCHGKKTLEDKAHVGPWPDIIAIEAAAPKKVWAF
jgi:5-methylcytosine-specific restriction protein A